MLTPLATLVFAAAMALSLSVEGESFFHSPVTASPAEADTPTADEPTNATDAGSDDAAE